MIAEEPFYRSMANYVIRFPAKDHLSVDLEAPSPGQDFVHVAARCNRLFHGCEPAVQQPDSLYIRRPLLGMVCRDVHYGGCEFPEIAQLQLGDHCRDLMSIRQHRKLGIQLFIDVCFRLFRKSQRNILLDNGDVLCLRLARGCGGVNVG